MCRIAPGFRCAFLNLIPIVTLGGRFSSPHFAEEKVRLGDGVLVAHIQSFFHDFGVAQTKVESGTAGLALLQLAGVETGRAGMGTRGDHS